jgi:hypothetical protein
VLGVDVSAPMLALTGWGFCFATPAGGNTARARAPEPSG